MLGEAAQFGGEFAVQQETANLYWCLSGNLDGWTKRAANFETGVTGNQGKRIFHRGKAGILCQNSTKWKKNGVFHKGVVGNLDERDQ